MRMRVRVIVNMVRGVVVRMPIRFRVITGINCGAGRGANAGADDGAIAAAEFSADRATDCAANRAAYGRIDSEIIRHDRGTGQHHHRDAA